MEQKITNVLRRNSEAYRAGHNLIVNQGGQGSSKNYSELQLFYNLAKNLPEQRIFTITSYALPHLKLGAIRDFENILRSAGENVNAIHNKTDKFFRIGQSIVEYFGIRDSKGVGPRRDYLYVNEINNRIDYQDFDHLFQRSHACTWVDYNPRNEFWLHDKVLPHFRHALIKSTFLDNPYLPKGELRSIMARKGKPEFENWWRVYALGEMGKFEGTILPNWENGEFDDTLPYGYGLDFGFHPDPDSFVKVAVDKKHKLIYAQECFYVSGLLPSELKDKVSEFASRNNHIIGDSADPRMIANLRTSFNIQGVKKTGTVAEWIRLMQDYKIIVCGESYNLEKELNNYVWNDRKAGIPVDAWNHLIDAIRYYFMNMNQLRPVTRAY
ncbi:hypothetical protein LCGC14_0974720 [marine sediment metagenome]|uniref:Phage terminase large subunit C-terminal domain-containing protein n=1 Tax=marine sediment metagenome TaxID=412755 RepID=A0A0F9NWR7_9ZZZZ